MSFKAVTRRRLIFGGASIVGLGALGRNAMAGALTPRASEGPFYPRPSMRMPDIDNDLVKIAGSVQEAGGNIIYLRGTIKGRDGEPLTGHRIEIWQCDLNGNYMHPRDRRSANFDPAFQSFGHDIAGDGGEYVFRTIRPAIYPGRAPHIHVKILDGNREVLTTQFYIKDHPLNADDFLYRRMSASEAQSVSMTFVENATGIEATIDVVV